MASSGYQTLVDVAACKPRAPLTVMFMSSHSLSLLARHESVFILEMTLVKMTTAVEE